MRSRSTCLSLLIELSHMIERMLSSTLYSAYVIDSFSAIRLHHSMEIGPAGICSSSLTFYARKAFPRVPFAYDMALMRQLSAELLTDMTLISRILLSCPSNFIVTSWGRLSHAPCSGTSANLYVCRKKSCITIS